jgi:hypothetical protein
MDHAPLPVEFFTVCSEEYGFPQQHPIPNPENFGDVTAPT